MKKLVSVLVIILFAVNYLHAQTTETLTNSSIIKMAKAKLSDDLIIDEINNSKVNFNLSSDSVKVLTNENVSVPVVQAMKTANEKQVQSTVNSQQSTADSPQSIVNSQRTTVNNPQTIVNNQPPIVSSQQTTFNSSQSTVTIHADTAKHISTESTVHSPQSTIGSQQTTIKSQQTAANNPQLTVSNQQSAVISQQTTVGNQILAVSGPQTTFTKPVVSSAIIVDRQETATKTESASKNSIDISTFTINSLSYISPLKQLITFYDNQFNTLKGMSQKWNQQIKDTLEKEKQIRKIIAQDEKDIADKMNSNAKGYSSEIINSKTKLFKDRDSYRRLKNDMANYGKNLSEQIKTLSKETDRQINDKFSEISKIVAKSHPSPSVGDTINTMIITKQSTDTSLVNHISPLNVVLTFYKNGINPICDSIVLWNKKALALIHQDAKLAKQVDPLNKELQQYESQAKSVRKLNKQHISDLKKQCKSLNDERNQLAKQMGDDSRKLSDQVDQLKKNFSAALKDRFNHAIENIEYSYEK
jgi:hypothetical protein